MQKTSVFVFLIFTFTILKILFYTNDHNDIVVLYAKIGLLVINH